MTRNPYKYLDYYTFDDSDIFFGREEEAYQIAGEVMTTRLQILFAPSGSGKTSLINAGVRPNLEASGYKTIYCRFDQEPIQSISNALSQQIGLESDPEECLHDILYRATHQEKKPLAIFLDQFEEFFVVFRDQQEARKAFILQIAAIRYDENLPVVFVLALREDYYAHLHEFRTAIPSIFQNNANIRLRPFGHEAARRALTRPLEAVGLDMEEALVSRVLADLEEDSGISPIALQVVAHSLWTQREGCTLDQSLYDRLGGSQAILDAHVSDALKKIPSHLLSLMERLLQFMITQDKTKRHCNLEYLINAIGETERLAQLLKVLKNCQLLRHERQAGVDWYELKHDYLAERLSDWINQRRQARNKKYLACVTVPSVGLLFGLMITLIWGLTTWSVGFTKKTYDDQEKQIIIKRKLPLFSNDIITTGILRSELKNFKAENEIEGGFSIDLMNWQKLNMLYISRSSKERHSGRESYKEIQNLRNTLLIGKNDQYITLEEKNKAFVSKLVGQLYDRDPDIRSNAAISLGLLGKMDQLVLNGLYAQLSDKEPEVRAIAARSLGILYSSLPIEYLIEKIHSRQHGVRTAAIHALVRQKKINRLSLAILAPYLKDKRPWVQLAADEACFLISQRLDDEKGFAAQIKSANEEFRREHFPQARYLYEQALMILPYSDDVNLDKATTVRIQIVYCYVRQGKTSEARETLKKTLFSDPKLKGNIPKDLRILVPKSDENK